MSRLAGYTGPLGALAGRGEPLLYLDYDGVLHPENVWRHPKKGLYVKSPEGHALFENIGVLEEALAPHPQVRIVLATTWARVLGAYRAAKKLPLNLREKVVGTTWHSAMTDSFAEMPRGLQVWADVRRRKPSHWLALDDSHEDWPAWCLDHYIRTPAVEGIGDPETAQRLRELLANMPKTVVPLVN